MKVAVPREIAEGETRVAVTPDVVQRLVKKEFEVLVEAGAGVASSFPDAEYVEAGASIVEDVEKLWGDADVVLKIHAPAERSGGKHEADLLKEGAALIALLFPLSEHDLVRRLAENKVTSFSLDQVPRITRAQSMDVLSSQSTVAGYHAVLLATTKLPKFLPMLTTAAGTIRPAKAVILGVGVAGLQAIATARRLGAVVKAYDIRKATKEQVESLGGTFIELPDFGDTETEGGYAKELTPEQVKEQQKHLAEHLHQADLIVTTALVPGRPAPKLITKEMAEGLRPGTVVLDMAAETGGNCELTVPGEDTLIDGVLYMGPENIPSRMPQDASRMFAKNLQNLLLHLAPEGDLAMDFEDEITRGSCITHDGEVVQERTRALLFPDEEKSEAPAEEPAEKAAEEEEEGSDS